jgi:hypothetical protein
MGLVVQCQAIPIPDSPPSIEIPHLGVIEKAWNSLNRIPNPDELLLQLYDALAALLAPVRRFLELVEIVVAIQDCFLALPKAILRMSPGPIYDCMTNLAKAIARVLSWIPPFAYIKMSCDIAAYCIDVLDEIRLLFNEIDSRLTEWITFWDEAQLTGDTDLASIVDCGAQEIKAQLVMVLDLMKIVKCLTDPLLSVFSRTIPDGSTRDRLAEAQSKYDESDAYMQSSAASMRAGGTSLEAYPGTSGSTKPQHALVPIPPIGDMFIGLNATRNALVLLYNVLAPLSGLEPDKEQREAPTFDNF